MREGYRIVSGMRPTGPLHLGHYFGVLQNWAHLQESAECFFFIADWHALTTDYADPGAISRYSFEVFLDWLAAGLDPEKSVFFQQSRIQEHAELQLLLSMITPLGWLERNPTYKEIKQELEAKDLNTLGFLGYPVLQAADIIIYHANRVPVGEDQIPHLELSREITRRFNYFYGETFPEPKPLLTESAKLPGLDGRKMSKSYDNAIFLGEEPNNLRNKIKTMLTDTNRMRLKDPGDPEKCNLFPYLKLLDPENSYEEIIDGCTGASRGCMDCKNLLFEKMEAFLEPIWSKRRELQNDPDTVKDIIHQGNKAARSVAGGTMEQVRSRMSLL